MTDLRYTHIPSFPSVIVSPSYSRVDFAFEFLFLVCARAHTMELMVSAYLPTTTYYVYHTGFSLCDFNPSLLTFSSSFSFMDVSLDMVYMIWMGFFVSWFALVGICVRGVVGMF